MPNIIQQVIADHPGSILDIGVGFGKYGVMLREVFDIPYLRYEKDQWVIKLDGVEGFRKYQNPIHDYVYNEVFYGDIRTIVHTLPQNYDTILLIDVLEHFEKEEGKQLLRDLLKKTNKSLILSTPLNPDVQLEYLGNTLEAHKSRWTIVDFADFDYLYQFMSVGDNGANLFKLFPPQEAEGAASAPPAVIETVPEREKLKIGYLLPHLNLTGGLKMLLHQMKELKAKGHEVYAFIKGAEGDNVVPNWFDLEVSKGVVVPAHEPFSNYTHECDVLVAGWIYQLEELKQCKEPVFYWEQGHEYLFGDIPNLHEGMNLRNYLNVCYKSGVPVASVSSYVAKVLKAKYQLDTKVIPNGIDPDFFYPEENKVFDKTEFNILLVGNPSLTFKGFDDALMALTHIWNRGYRFTLTWICQFQPGYRWYPFPIHFVVHPLQPALAEHFRKSDLLIFPSYYEGFGMPPLEAMASGVPVVATKCGGIADFAVNGYNSLLVEPRDILPMTDSIAKLLDDPELRRTFSAAGRETALRFSYKGVIEKLEDYMYELAAQNSKE